MTARPRGILPVMGSSPGATTPPAGTPDDSRLRFRVWVDGALADEYWLDTSTATDEDAEAAAMRQAGIVARAGDRPWLVEIYDPARRDGAYTRWGTDVTGMVCPVEVPAEHLESTLNGVVTARYGGDGDGGPW